MQVIMHAVRIGYAVRSIPLSGRHLNSTDKGQHVIRIGGRRVSGSGFDLFGASCGDNRICESVRTDKGQAVMMIGCKRVSGLGFGIWGVGLTLSP